MSSTRPGKEKVAVQIKSAAAQLRELLSDPPMFPEIFDIVKKTIDLYTQPDWGVGTDWFILAKLTRSNDASALQTQFDAHNEQYKTPYFDSEPVLITLRDAFSHTEWTGPCLNTLLLTNLLKNLLAPKHHYDDQEVLSHDNLLLFRDELIDAIKLELTRLARERAIAARIQKMLDDAKNAREEETAKIRSDRAKVVKGFIHATNEAHVKEAEAVKAAALPPPALPVVKGKSLDTDKFQEIRACLGEQLGNLIAVRKPKIVATTKAEPTVKVAVPPSKASLMAAKSKVIATNASLFAELQTAHKKRAGVSEAGTEEKENGVTLH